MSYYQLISIMPKSSVDPDAQAFITAAAITNPTQQQAINKLVVDLKGYGIWSKMKAIYPFVGGTASTHKFNLKDPRDLDAAFRLVFTGGWTHSITGAQPNGTNGYADTKLNLNANLGLNSTHLSYYSRIDASTNSVEMGVSGTTQTYLLYRYGSNAYKGLNRPQAIAGNLYTPTTGLLIANRNSSTQEKYFHKGVLIDTINANSTSMNNVKIFIGCYSNNDNPQEYSTKQCAFASIGDGLTDTDASNLYTAVQTYQTTLGRSIGTQTVSDPDAQAFVTAANIQDQVQADAVNNLTIGLKADGLWSKMKAIYPFVGGDAASHKFNLKNPLDTDAAFRLVFSGGWTHSATGALPNGTNAFADTFFIPSTNLSLTNAHFSLYSRTQTASLVGQNYAGSGIYQNTNSGFNISLRRRFDNKTIAQIYTDIRIIDGGVSTDARGYYISTRISNNSFKLFKNSNLLNSNINTETSGILPTLKVFLSGMSGTTSGGGITPLNETYDNKELAFASIGDGLTDTEAANLYSRVQTYQTALNRQV